MTADDGHDDGNVGASSSPPTSDLVAFDPVQSVTDAALLDARQALVAARALPLPEQPAALEAVQATLSARLGDVQNA